MTTNTRKVSIKLWQNINEELFKVVYLIKLRQYFGNHGKAVIRSHYKKFLSKVFKILAENNRFKSSSFMFLQNLIETLYELIVVHIS